MSDPSAATKTCPECGTENMAEAVTCANDSCTHIFGGEEVETVTTSPSASTVEPPLAAAPPMAESAAPVSAASEPPPATTMPDVAPTIQPPPTPMPPAGSAPSTYAPPSMTTPPPYTSPVYTQSAPPLASSGKSKVTAGILGIVLGALGVHHFYLGNIKMGVIFLVVSVVGAFCTLGIGTGVMSVLGLVQGIMYLVATDEDFERKYVQEQKFF
jgi:TM2 domain-containing membrane protein YozV